MRTYKYNGIRAIESNILLSFNKRIRGLALGWVIVHKIPEDCKSTTEKYTWEKRVFSDNGNKTLDAILRHEALHIKRQQEYGVFKWMYKYFTDKEFHDNEERLAREAE